MMMIRDYLLSILFLSSFLTNTRVGARTRPALDGQRERVGTNTRVGARSSSPLFMEVLPASDVLKEAPKFDAKKEAPKLDKLIKAFRNLLDENSVEIDSWQVLKDLYHGKVSDHPEGTKIPYYHLLILLKLQEDLVKNQLDADGNEDWKKGSTLFNQETVSKAGNHNLDFHEKHLYSLQKAVVVYFAVRIIAGRVFVADDEMTFDIQKMIEFLERELLLQQKKNFSIHAAAVFTDNHKNHIKIEAYGGPNMLTLEQFDNQYLEKMLDFMNTSLSSKSPAQLGAKDLNAARAAMRLQQLFDNVQEEEEPRSRETLEESALPIVASEKYDITRSDSGSSWINNRVIFLVALVVLALVIILVVLWATGVVKMS